MRTPTFVDGELEGCGFEGFTDKIFRTALLQNLVVRDDIDQRSNEQRGVFFQGVLELLLHNRIFEDSAEPLDGVLLGFLDGFWHGGGVLGVVPVE